MSSAIKTPAFQAKASNILNEDNSSIYSGGEWSFKNASAVTGFHVASDGKVGVGTTSPGAKLHVTGSVKADSGFVSAASGITTILSADASGSYLETQGANNQRFFTNGAERMRIASDGVVTFNSSQFTGGTIELNIFGNGDRNTYIDFHSHGAPGAVDYSARIIKGAGASSGFAFENGSNGVSLAVNGNSWSPISSDERKKKNFETTQGLSEVLQIEPVKYHFNSEEDSATKRLGFKAQNLQPLVPEMVYPTGEKAEDGSDYLTITPDYLIPVLVKAIQEQQAMIEELKAKVSALESK